jgi:hypothetical protein
MGISLVNAGIMLDILKARNAGHRQHKRRLHVVQEKVHRQWMNTIGTIFDF